MDWERAIERNREALKRVVATMVAMVSLSTSVEGRLSLPRHLHRAVLALLRPAESAARRLVIVAARGLALPLPAGRRVAERRRRRNPPCPAPMPDARPAAPARLCLPLFDSLRRPFARRSASAVPRISVPGVTALFPVRPRHGSKPWDLIDATRLDLRLSAIAAALDDLPRQAQRFARWRARADARRLGHSQPPPQRAAASMLGQRKEKRRAARFARIWPLRSGRPPGLCRRGRRSAHEIHELLTEIDALAKWAMERPDTS
jgi:hypothetical protein